MKPVYTGLPAGWSPSTAPTGVWAPSPSTSSAAAAAAAAAAAVAAATVTGDASLVRLPRSPGGWKLPGSSSALPEAVAMRKRLRARAARRRRRAEVEEVEEADKLAAAGGRGGSKRVMRRLRGRWNPCCSCLFSMLPDDVLLFRVFPWLSLPDLAAAAAVCSRWRFNLADNWLWRSVHISRLPRALRTEARMTSLVRCMSMSGTARAVRSLRLCGASALLDSSIMAAVTSMPKLADVHLCGCSLLTTAAVSHLFTTASALEKVALNGVAGVTDAALAPVAAGATPLLRELALRNCKLLTDETLRCLAAGCRRLRVLDVGGCTNMTATELAKVAAVSPRLHTLRARGVDGIDDAFLLQLVDSCSQLQCVDVSSSNPFGGRAGITAVGIAALARSAGSLRQLALQGASKVTSAALLQLAEAAPALEELNLGGCRAVTTAGVVAIARRCQQLRSLVLWGCRLVEDGALDALAANAPALTSLDLQGCTRLTLAALRRLLASCSMMRKLFLGGLPIAKEELAALRADWPQLEVFAF
eukprot:PLAT15882.1.p1 GENE.PLAT15882.1~~PLAT15882.1.p1  ORF type:complete len:531 (+),score=265.89 PLAT15882.1:50-1642(+)